MPRFPGSKPQAFSRPRAIYRQSTPVFFKVAMADSPIALEEFWRYMSHHDLIGLGETATLASAPP